jgi:hypothetical protein
MNISVPDRALCETIGCGGYPDYSAVPGGVATVMACSQTYGAMAFSLCDPKCKPHWDAIRQNNPSLNPATQCSPKVSSPSAVPAAVVNTPAQPPVTLTPTNISPSLPNISKAMEPVPMPVQRCSVWCDVNAAIAQNPGTSALILAGLALLFIGGRRG